MAPTCTGEGGSSKSTELNLFRKYPYTLWNDQQLCKVDIKFTITPCKTAQSLFICLYSADNRVISTYRKSLWFGYMTHPMVLWSPLRKALWVPVICCPQRANGHNPLTDVANCTAPYGLGSEMLLGWGVVETPVSCIIECKGLTDCPSLCSLPWVNMRDH